jgi:S-adenosylmethionine hydrolase
LTPGVGTNRKSIVLKSKTGQYFISPDNGILTLINQLFGAEKIIEINENDHLLPNTTSKTSYGRDLYVYLVARLASKAVNFGNIGVTLSTKLVEFIYKKPIINKEQLIGTVQIHDGYGNIWTNITLDLVNEYRLDIYKMYRVEIFFKTHKYYDNVITFCKTYDDVELGSDLLYINSVSCLAFGINQSNFAKHYNVGFGCDWYVQISNSPQLIEQIL